MEKIRILHVLGSLNMGGAETLIMNLYRNIDRRKIQFDFVVHTNEIGVYEDEIKKLGGKIFRISRYKGINHFAYKKEWINFFKEHNEYKIIHGHMRSTASIYLEIAKKYGRVTICHSHNTSNGKGISSLIKRILQYNIRNISDYFMGCSYEANKWLFGEKIANKNECIILKNGIDVDKFKYDIDIRNKVRRELKIDDNDYVIGNIGRLCFQKNQNYLLDIFNEFIKKEKNSKLIIIGSGELEEELKNKIEKLQLSNNILMLKNRNDINELMCAMDCFVFPSKFEGLGIVVVEAQANGLPCFISDTIPKEVILTNNVKYLDINDNPINWSEKIFENRNINNRKDRVIEIKEKGYCIKKCSNFLSDFYFQILK